MISQRRATILVVDDNPTNLEVLAEAVGREADVIIATNGKDALELALVEDIDVILLDVMMPEMDGYEVCRRLKADDITRDTPVIFVTALADEANEEHGISLGAVDYITKPISPHVVKARVANHVTLKRQRDFLRRLSSVDGLTGVASRRAFDEALDREWRRSLRTHQPMSLMLVDIDRFKSFNERYGHGEGDTLLKQIAWALADQIKRPTDLVARYNGNRFAILLPESEAEEAREAANNILTSVHSLGVTHQDSDVAQIVTTSIGLATTVPTNARDPRDLISRADQMLYEGKRVGRNRVHAGNL